MRGTHILSTTGEEEVRTPREIERARDTDKLSSAKEGTSQNTKRRCESKGHSLSVNHRGRNRSRIPREHERARNTHPLSTTEGGTSQNTRERE